MLRKAPSVESAQLWALLPPIGSCLKCILLLWVPRPSQEKDRRREFPHTAFLPPQINPVHPSLFSLLPLPSQRHNLERLQMLGSRYSGFLWLPENSEFKTSLYSKQKKKKKIPSVFSPALIGTIILESQVQAFRCKQIFSHMF